MSRLCGVIDFSGNGHALSSALAAMAQTMRHSRDYQSETHTFDSAALARIDFGAGPNFSSTSRNLIPGQTCICAGYVTDLDSWRDRILRDSQGKISASTAADIITYLLHTSGPKSLDQLNGTFAFASWNNQARSIHLGVDRLGMRPLYYLRRGTVVKFASEIKAISLTESNLTIDRGSLEDLVVLSFVTGDRTHYTEIERIPIGTVVTIDSRSEKSCRYWWFDRLAIDNSLTVPEFIEQSTSALNRAVERLLPLCDRKICTLSSGNDSRRVFLELVKSGSQFEAFTAAVPLKGSLWECDSVIAKALCNQFGIPQNRTDFYDPTLEPKLAGSTFSLLDCETDQHRWALPMIKEIPLNRGINFDGFGGDIYVYDTSLVTHLLGAGADNHKLAQHLITFNYGSSERDYLRPSRAGSVVERHAACLAGLPQDDNRNTAWFSALWARRRTSPFSMALMGLKVESVFPYLDNEVVELSMRLAPRLKVDRDLQFEILQNQYPDLMRRVPTSGHPSMTQSPDDFCRPFVSPIPQSYYERRTSSYYRSIAARLISGSQVRRIVSRQSVVSAVTVASLGAVGLLSPGVLRSAWRLRPLGLIAEIVECSANRELAIRRLTDARAYLFGDSAISDF